MKGKFFSIVATKKEIAYHWVLELSDALNQLIISGILISQQILHTHKEYTKVKPYLSI